jgi:hypothetical protein
MTHRLAPEAGMTSRSAFIDTDRVTSQRVTEFRTYWRHKGGEGGLPLRVAIDPAQIPRLLPYLVIAEIERSPFRVRYRLVGTRAAQANGSDFTNRYLDECGFAVEPLLTECYRRLIKTRAPVFAYYEWHKRDWGHRAGSVGASETGFFPLSSDGATVDLAISVADSDIVPYPPGQV